MLQRLKAHNAKATFFHYRWVFIHFTVQQRTAQWKRITCRIRQGISSYLLILQKIHSDFYTFFKDFIIVMTLRLHRRWLNLRLHSEISSKHANALFPDLAVWKTYPFQLQRRILFLWSSRIPDKDMLFLCILHKPLSTSSLHPSVPQCAAGWGQPSLQRTYWAVRLHDFFSVKCIVNC